MIYQNWSVTRGLIKSSDAASLQTATPLGWIGHGPATCASPGKTAFLEHASELMDQPLEWFLDREERRLHFIAKGNHAAATIVAPLVEQLLIVSGTPENPVRNLHFEGIHFEHCDFQLPKIGYNEIQAAHFGTTLEAETFVQPVACLLYTSPSPRDATLSRMPSSA